MTSVTAIVPARNEEANIERAVRSLAAQPEIAEIIVVDDESSDRTGEILRKLSAEIPHLRVMANTSLPEGWVGKNRAVWMGASEARQPWLLFSDADTTHLPGSTARALADAEKHGADFVSYSPEQEMHKWWERAMIPLVYSRLADLFPYGKTEYPFSRPAANGQYILVRRGVYFAFGGHQAVRGEVVEDVALARRARDAGSMIYFARGEGIARTQMYRTFGEMWAGWRKNLYPLVGGTPRAIFRELVVVFPWMAIVLFALMSWMKFFAIPALGSLYFKHVWYTEILRPNRYPSSCIIYYLPAAFLYSAALVASAAAHARGRVAWKGREYKVGPE